MDSGWKFLYEAWLLWSLADELWKVCCCFILKFLSEIHSVIYKIGSRENALFAYTKNATIH